MSPLKKFTAALAVFVVAGVATMVLYYKPAPSTPTLMQHQYNMDTLSIGSTTVVAEVADTDALRSLGLGGRTSLEEGRGMWFVFDEDGPWAFWMKDTLIPLDILWVDKGGNVVYIAHDVRPESYPQSYAPPVPARYVLEVPGGWAQAHGVVEGDRVQQN